MKYLLITFCLLFSHALFAQKLDLEAAIKSNAASNKMQNKLIAELQNILEAQNWKIDTVTDIADINTANIEMISDTMHLKVLDAHSRAHDAHDRIADVDAIVASNKTNWMVGSSVFLLLLGLLFLLLKKQIDTAADNAERKRASTESTLRQDASKLEQQLSDAHRAQVATELKLAATTNELESVDKALSETQKELESTNKALDETNKELAETNKALAALKLPKTNKKTK